MPTILVIDDDVAQLARLGGQLEGAGYATLRASDVRHAELLLEEQAPDLVLLEPATNRDAGWELLERISARIPVIVVSGQGLEEDVVRGLEAGAVDYVTKPFRSSELLARLRRHLRQAPMAEPPPAEPPPEQLDAPAEIPPAPAEAKPAPAPPPAPPPAPARRPRRADEDEEKVFITYGEEQRLLNEQRPARDEELRADDLAQLSLGRRLRAARMRKRITLVQAELESKLRMHYIQAMEEEKFSLLPRGPIAADLLRSYAGYLGLDVNQALDEYRRLHYSAPIEPPPSLGVAPPPRALPRWAVWLPAIVLALVVGFGGIWLIDPGGITAMAGRARALVAPPTNTPTALPTNTPTALPTSTPTALPTATNTPTPTARPTEPATDTPTPRRKA